MEKKKRTLVHGQCPQCACGDVSFVPSEEMKEKYTGPEKEIDILCPSCGPKMTGKLTAEDDK